MRWVFGALVCALLLLTVPAGAQREQVRAKELTADGLVGDSRACLLGIHYVDTGTSGSVDFLDGGSGGTLRIGLATPGSSAAEDITIPGFVVFNDGIYVDVTNVTSVTVFWHQC